MRLWLDTETRSATPIEHGTDKYTRDCECMIVTYAFEDGPVKIWEPWQDPIPPQELWEALRDPAVIVIAHNTAFDRLVLLRALHMDIPVERWECTMAKANAHALHGSLEVLGIIAQLPEHLRKLSGDDYKLIDTFCVPQKSLGRFIEPWERPSEWTRFKEYAIRDTDSLRAIDTALPVVNYRGENLESWHLDQLINARGFGFDSDLAKAAASFLADAKVVSDDIISAASGNQVHAATQRDRLLRYLRDKCNVPIESLRASEVVEWLERDDLDPIVRTLLEQRLDSAKSSGAKYARGLQMVGPGSRIRHWCRWNGAGRTGRHAGRGFQPQNLASPYLRVWGTGGIERIAVEASYIDDVVIPGIYSHEALNNPLVYGGPYEAAALALRHVIVAAPGNVLMVADFKNIESVITAWIAGETLQLQAFGDSFENPKDKSKDVYCILAGKILGKHPADVTKVERQMGKVCILAFGFGGGVSALVNMAIAYQLDLEPIADIVLPTATPEQLTKAHRAWRRAASAQFVNAPKEGTDPDEQYDFGLEKRVYMACDVLKQAYRSANSAIDTMRKNVDMATRMAVKNPGSVHNVARCRIWSTGSFLIIELPSGRRLLYANPQLKTDKFADPDTGETWENWFITFKTARGKSWRQERAWSGLFVENIVQATANDILRAAMKRVHRDTLSVPAIARYLATLPLGERTAISLHVHDEVGLDLPAGSYSKERFLKVLTERPTWAADLPIAADLWVNTRYGKR